MEWQVIAAMVVGIPVVLFPVVYVWYIVIWGIVATRRVPRDMREALNKDNRAMNPLPQNLEPEYKDALVRNLEMYLDK